MTQKLHSGHLSQRNEDIFTQNLYTNHYCSLFHWSQKLETMHTPFNASMIKHMWHIHNMEYYSEMKNNKLLIHTTPWMND